MKGEFFINGIDATTYGITLGDDSFTALLTPPPVKDYVANKSALSHGKQVLNDTAHAPRLDERDVQITLYLHAKDLSQFLARYQEFCKVLQKGRLDLRTKYQPTEIYHCIYISCSQFAQFNGRLGKFVLKLNEPNPNNRTVQ